MVSAEWIHVEFTPRGEKAALTKISFTNFTTGKSHYFGGEYLELTPKEPIRHTDISSALKCSGNVIPSLFILQYPL
jgi:hypothetical protein